MKKYLMSFLIGGALSVVAELVFEALLSTGADFGLCITLMLGVMSGGGAVFAALGLYQKLESAGEFGAFLPFSGFASAITEITAASLGEGKSFPEACKTGLHGAAVIFGIGFPLGLAVAFIAGLVQGG